MECPTCLMNDICSLSDLSSAKGILIASLNIRSVMQHFDEIKLILEHRDIDILLLQETFLYSSISNAVIEIDGYNLFRNDRDSGTGKRGGGGLITYSKK